MRRSQHARKETEFLRLKRTRLGLEDFESLKVIGRGAFGEVRAERECFLKHFFFIISISMKEYELVTGRLSSTLGSSGAEKGHRSCLCNEDPSES